MKNQRARGQTSYRLTPNEAQMRQTQRNGAFQARAFDRLPGPLFDTEGVAATDAAAQSGQFGIGLWRVHVLKPSGIKREHLFRSAPPIPSEFVRTSRIRHRLQRS